MRTKNREPIIRIVHRIENPDISLVETITKSLKNAPKKLQYVVQSVVRVCFQRLQPLMSIRIEPNNLRRDQTSLLMSCQVFYNLLCTKMCKSVIKGRIIFDEVFIFWYFSEHIFWMNKSWIIYQHTSQFGPQNSSHKNIF